MKNSYSIFLQAVLSVLLICSFAFAAPTIDGTMQYTSANDWGGSDMTQTRIDEYESYDTNRYDTRFNSSMELGNVVVEQGTYSGAGYDLEELGVYIDDNILYIGIQTDYDLSITSGAVLPGDFIFSFDEGGNKTFADNAADFAANGDDAIDFAFSFTVDGNSVDFTLLAGDITGTGVGSDFNNYNTDWGVSDATLSQEFEDAGVFTHNTYDSNGLYTIEAAIDLSQLQGELLDVFTSFASTSVTMYWQPSCGNDFLAASTDFAFTPNEDPSHTPEPATLLLFGMGLLGVGAYGRKRQNNEEK
jgi:hypothetical protein